jgi:hypothetical protein
MKLGSPLRHTNQPKGEARAMTNVIEHRSTGVAVCQKCNHLDVCGYVYFYDLKAEIVLCGFCIAMLTIEALRVAGDKGRANG